MPRTGTERMRLERVLTELPAGFEALRAEARAEGYRHLDRLAEEWNTKTTRFDLAGEALFGAWVGRELAGIGGLTIDPVLPDALRMRRFYVRKSFRRNGIGRAIADNLVAQAQGSACLLTVNAAAGSEAFWASCGFALDCSDGHTHVLPPGKRPLEKAV